MKNNKQKLFKRSIIVENFGGGRGYRWKYIAGSTYLVSGKCELKNSTKRTVHFGMSFQNHCQKL